MRPNISLLASHRASGTSTVCFSGTSQDFTVIKDECVGSDDGSIIEAWCAGIITMRQRQGSGRSGSIAAIGITGGVALTLVTTKKMLIN